MGVAEPTSNGGPDGLVPEELTALAELYGIETVHRDGFGREVWPSAETLLGVLKAMGSPMSGVSDASEALREIRARRSERKLPSVSVLPAGGPHRLPVGPVDVSPGRKLGVRVVTEEGEEYGWKLEAAASSDGAAVELPAPLPVGYHRVALDLPGNSSEEESEGLLMVAPPKAYSGMDDVRSSPLRDWGGFLPLYAIRSRRNWGVGDLTDLEELRRWVSDMGGAVAATLPLFASFLDEPFEPSPYAPVSRLFWNELYLDPTTLPEWSRTPEARAQVDSSAFHEEIERCRTASRVAYRDLARLKRGVFDLLAAAWERDGGRDDPDFGAFLRARPQAERYAGFRAAMETDPVGWEGERPRWWREGVPERIREGERARRHLYVQFQFHERLGRLPDGSTEGSAGLYLDLPLGTHPLGFDPWAEPDLFGRGAAIGAPPDDFHEGGQNWSLPPIRPAEARLREHRHFREVLGTLLPHARYLRIDHVMGLHRLYWIPEMRDARDGAYVRYPAEELYAILCIESHRHRTVLVGEDLGTVPPGIREAMTRRDLRRMYVVPFERRDDRPDGLAPVPDGAVASLNTHDMPPFAEYWRQSGESEKADQALRRLLQRLAKSPAGLVLINLEDLWLEERPQNLPGTSGPENWTRKAELDLETFTRDLRVLTVLRDLARCREGMDPQQNGTVSDDTTTSSRERSGHAQEEG